MPEQEGIVLPTGNWGMMKKPDGSVGVFDLTMERAPKKRTVVFPIDTVPEINGQEWQSNKQLDKRVNPASIWPDSKFDGIDFGGTHFVLGGEISTDAMGLTARTVGVRQPADAALFELVGDGREVKELEDTQTGWQSANDKPLTLRHKATGKTVVLTVEEGPDPNRPYYDKYTLGIEVKEAEV